MSASKKKEKVKIVHVYSAAWSTSTLSAECFTSVCLDFMISHFCMSEFMSASKKKEKVKVVHLYSAARSTGTYLQNTLQLHFPDFWLNVKHFMILFMIV